MSLSLIQRVAKIIQLKPMLVVMHVQRCISNLGDNIWMETVNRKKSLFVRKFQVNQFEINILCSCVTEDKAMGFR